MMKRRKALSELAQGFRKRTMVTARLATKTGMKMLGKTLNPNGKAKEVDEDRAIRAAEELAETMGEMKGLVMKLGQMASYLEGSMPEPAQRVLAQLQAQSTPLEYEAAAEIIEDDLGGEPDVLFDDFEREPFAAASLGQVHRAVLDGEPVAVKVQYPEIAKALRSDLRTLGTFAKVGTLFSSVDGGGLIDELEARMHEECDYAQEVENQQLFADLLSRVPGATVPAVYPDKSGARVITSAFCDGKRFEEFRQTATQEERNRAAAIIFDACFSSIFRHGVFNADPHPGNYLFTGAGEDVRVAFLDFGCVKRFTPEHVATWKRFARVVQDGDRDAFPEVAMAMDLVLPGQKVTWDYQWEMMRFIYRPYIEPGFRFTSDYVKESYDVMMFKNPDRFRQHIPPDALFKNRLQWGLYSILSSLEAQADWPRLFRDAVETELEPV